MDIRDKIRSLGNEFEREDNAAFNLWSWLPSCKAAEKHHGDHSGEFSPCIADVMIEAALFISHRMNPNEKEIKEAGELYQCPCGEDFENMS